MSNNEVNDGGVPLTCPDACFDIPPYQVVQTQSGVVNARNCPTEFFQDLPQSHAADLGTEKNLNQYTVELQDAQQIISPNEPLQQLLHVQMNDESTPSQEKAILLEPAQTRMADMPQIQISCENALLSRDDAESIVSSFIGHWMIYMMFLLVLSFFMAFHDEIIDT